MSIRSPAIWPGQWFVMVPALFVLADESLLHIILACGLSRPSNLADTDKSLSFTYRDVEKPRHIATG